MQSACPYAEPMLVVLSPEVWFSENKRHEDPPSKQLLVHCVPLLVNLSLSLSHKHWPWNPWNPLTNALSHAEI